MKPAPIVLFVYNRPWHTRKTLEALRLNPLAAQSELYIFSDGPKSTEKKELDAIQKVRAVIREKDWCKTIHLKEQSENKGLADSIIEGITQVLLHHESVIVLEDDIVTSPGFLKYMNDALSVYHNDEKVMHVAGYIYPLKQPLPQTFFFNLGSCHGWATWKSAWQLLETDASTLLQKVKERKLEDRFNIEGSNNFLWQLEANISGQIKTWATKWYATILLNDGHCLHPGKSLIRNIGADGSGVHFDINFDYEIKEVADKISVERIEIQEDQQIRAYIAKYLKKINNKSILERILLNLRRIPVRIRNLAKR